MFLGTYVSAEMVALLRRAALQLHCQRCQKPQATGTPNFKIWRSSAGSEADAPNRRFSELKCSFAHSRMAQYVF